MNISRERLLAEASQTGFRAEILEKVIRLLGLLQGMNRHPVLKSRLALKGGAALNLFLFDLPRLSVDLDLNYIGAVERTVMDAERPGIEQAIRTICRREGLGIRRCPEKHAGGKWQLTYTSPLGSGGHLDIDLNFLLRTPLWPPAVAESRPIGSFRTAGIPVLDAHELAAGKLVALLARRAGRDLFDAHHLLTRLQLDRTKLRLGFVVYGAMNRKDWRTVSVEDVTFEVREIRRQLVPLLRQRDIPGARDLEAWVEQLLNECRELLSAVLPLDPGEREFLDRLLDTGEIAPEALTDDPETAERIASHPALLWKALNARRNQT